MFDEESLAWLHVAMDKNVPGETYEAFKARKWQEIRTRLAGRTQATKQKLLRVHLQHFLLTIGAEVEQQRRRIKPDQNVVYHKELVFSKADANDASRSFANEQKRLAIAREAAKAVRYRSATTIQNFVRHRLMLRDNKIAENEEELPSTSVLIPLTPENQVVAFRAEAIEIPPTKVDFNPAEPPLRATLPPYEVVIELVAARDISLLSSLDEKYLEIEMLLKRQSVEIARVDPARQFVSSFKVNKAEIPLHDCCLRFSLDLNNGLKHGLASPQSVIDELIATVVVKDIGNNNGSSASMLGVVEIPLSLLETALATEYALCRWFPLEKAYAGHSVRGDLRVSVSYLMRQTSPDTAVMIPYVNTASKSDEVQVELESKKPATRRVKKTAVAQRKPASKAFERGQMRGKSGKLQPAVLSLKGALSSPIGRISRAEALSPPSSPSSVASSEPSDNVDSPKPDNRVKPSRRFFPPRRQLKNNVSKAVPSSPPMEEQLVETKHNAPRTPPKNFLKRKPYKVVFHKLDWSGVASKTNSNMPANGSNGVGSRPSKPSQTSSRASSSSATTSNCDSTGMNVDSVITPKPGAFLDAATAQRLATLESAMYERCGVTRETASLVRFKHQKERKQFVATLEGQTQARRGDTEANTQPEQPPSQDSSELEVCDVISEAAVTGLWKKLTSDFSGKIYASMLRSLIEKQVKTIEPTEHVDTS
ncbi:hypothetical protein V7S43_012730 [Phytophthora oleae]|uniref:Uncharacterized protein n=1 Tax=Phytophthora oleae TaxID=2107226 RepID=A0ABD3F6B7_9STRA